MSSSPNTKPNRAGNPKQKTHRLVRFNSGAGCRDAKASPKSQISNGFRQSIAQHASHIASHSILTSLILFVHVYLYISRQQCHKVRSNFFYFHAAVSYIQPIAPLYISTQQHMPQPVDS